MHPRTLCRGGALLWLWLVAVVGTGAQEVTVVAEGGAALPANGSDVALKLIRANANVVRRCGRHFCLGPSNRRFAFVGTCPYTAALPVFVDSVCP
jgi:hypothetical protein